MMFKLRVKEKEKHEAVFQKKSELNDTINFSVFNLLNSNSANSTNFSFSDVSKWVPGGEGLVHEESCVNGGSVLSVL